MNPDCKSLTALPQQRPAPVIPFRSKKGNHSMIVMKFGGSSVESAKAIQRVASIVRDSAGLHPAVVVSAMGKTTDNLLALARLSVEGNRQAVGRELAKLRQFHLTEAASLT